MKKGWLLMAVFLMGCVNRNVDLETQNDAEEIDSQIVSEEIDVEGKSLNDNRFGDWEDDEWLDNDYIREVRRYLDDYNRGVIVDEKMEPYREIVKSKFVIAYSEPFLLGGLFLNIIFLDDADKIFDTWVYSDVNEDTGAITGYHCYGLQLAGEDSGFTKEQILEIMQKHPEIKLW